MILVTGGAYQGKLEAAKNICRKQNPVIAEGENACLEEMERADIISHFHLYMKKLMQEGTEPEEQVKELVQKNPNVILTVTQLGCGVVPMDAFDRSYREKVGRISCKLAKQAKQVYLVNCGIIKPLK